MMLPHPLLTWEQAYEVLVSLSRRDPAEATVEALGLIAGMQGDEPLDPWIFEGLLGLAGIDLEDEKWLEFATQVAAQMQGAGLLVVEGGWFARALGTEPGAWGFRYRELIRLDLLQRLCVLESEYTSGQPTA